MPEIENVGVFCFLASYLVALVAEYFRLNKSTRLTRGVALLFSCAGFLAHTIYLISRSQARGLPPLVGSAHDWFLVLAWLVMLFYLFRTLKDRNLALGVFSYPPVILLVLSAYFLSTDPNDLINKSNLKMWGMLHASVLVFGILGVMLSFISSMMFLYQHHQLRRKRFILGGLHLPNLEKLAKLNWWSVIISVPLLSLGMASGIALAFYVNNTQETEKLTLTDPIILSNGVVWLVMSLFFIRLLTKKSPTSRQVARMTLWACGFMLFTLLGLQILSQAANSSIKTWHSSIHKTQYLLDRSRG